MTINITDEWLEPEFPRDYMKDCIFTNRLGDDKKDWTPSKLCGYRGTGMHPWVSMVQSYPHARIKNPDYKPEPEYEFLPITINKHGFYVIKFKGGEICPTCMMAHKDFEGFISPVLMLIPKYRGDIDEKWQVKMRKQSK